MYTKFQDEARRANAQHSTGPKTERGKAISRENATKHGLAGKGVCLTPEMRQLFEERRFRTGALIDHHDVFSVQLEEELVLAKVRMELCRRARFRAITEDWDHTHLAEAHFLADKLARRPGVVTHELEGTLEGVAWKISRLEWLVEALAKKRDFTPLEHALAYDLMGTPAMERTAEFDTAKVDEALADLGRELERLRSRLDNVLLPGRDEDKDMALLGIPVRDTKQLALLHRYERDHTNRFFELAKELRLKPREGPALSAPLTITETEDAPDPEAAPKTNDDLEDAAKVETTEVHQVTDACVNVSVEEVNACATEAVLMSTEPSAAAVGRDEPAVMSQGLEGLDGSRGPARPLTRFDKRRLRRQKR